MKRRSQGAIISILGNLSNPRMKKLQFGIMCRLCPVLALKTALKWIHPEVYSHCRNVERLSRKIGKEYESLFNKILNTWTLKNAAFFHDIGKLYLEDELLAKRQLSATERWRLRKHPEYGAQIIRGILNPRIQEAVISHHEEIRGKGYPRGVKGDRISLLAEIVSAADDFCAMTETRGYNTPLTTEKAIVEIEKEVDVRYDQRIVLALKGAINKGKR